MMFRGVVVAWCSAPVEWCAVMCCYGMWCCVVWCCRIVVISSCRDMICCVLICRASFRDACAECWCCCPNVGALLCVVMCCGCFRFAVFVLWLSRRAIACAAVNVIVVVILSVFVLYLECIDCCACLVLQAVVLFDHCYVVVVALLLMGVGDLLCMFTLCNDVVCLSLLRCDAWLKCALPRF